MNTRTDLTTLSPEQAAVQAKALIADVMRMRVRRAHGGASTDITSLATIDWMASRLDWAGHDYFARVADFDARLEAAMADFDAAEPERMLARANEARKVLWEGDGRTRSHLNDTWADMKAVYGEPVARAFVEGLGYSDALVVLR
jgi:hypothetical protein